MISKEIHVYSFRRKVGEITLDGMCRVCCLRLGPNFGVHQASDKIFYLQSTAEKMYAFMLLQINI